MTFSSTTPLNSQVMSLLPSPFMPDQFIPHNHHNGEFHPDQDMSEPQGFIKKRPIEVTEDLVMGRVDHRRIRRSRRPRMQQQHTPMECTESCDSPMQVDATARPKEPHDTECRRQSRRYTKTRRAPYLRRACSPPLCDASPFMRSRSPLGRWTPPAISTFQLYSVDSSDLPSTPVRPTSLVFEPPAPGWTSSGYPWTIPSPSHSPSHSPISHSEEQSQ